MPTLIAPGSSPGKMYIATVVSYMLLTEARVTDERSDMLLPCLDLSYDLRSLEPLSVLLRAMVERKVSPRVYIWNDEEPRAEIAVVFRLDNPTGEVLERLTPYAGTSLTNVACIISTAEVDADPSGVRALLRRFEQTKRLLVAITEIGGSTDDVAPLNMCVVSQIHREMPTSL